MGPVATSIVSAAIPSVLGFAGAERKHHLDKKEAERNRSFQERMRNTQWQAAVEDMRQAGINPALAYQSGPNAAPGGSTAAGAENPVTSAMQAASARKNIQLLEQQVRSAKAQADIDTETARVQTQRPKLRLDPGDGPTDVDGRSLIARLATMDEEQHRLGIQGKAIENVGLGLTNALTGARTRQTQYLGDISGVGSDIANRFGMLAPLAAFLAAPGGAGISSARGLSKWLQSRSRKPSRRPIVNPARLITSGSNR